MRWDKPTIEIALELLRDSYVLSAAIDRINDRFNHISITTDALRRAFRRNGLKHPKNYLKKLTIADAPPVDKVPGSFCTITYRGIAVPAGDLSVSFETKSGDKFTEIPCVIEKEPITRIIVCPDAHHPYVDKKAWKAFIAACHMVKPDVLVIIGDFGDILSLSAHPKKPKDEKSFKAELAPILAALDEIQAIGIKRVIFIEGNHENRISRYIANKAPELDGMIDAKSLFKIDERGWEWVAYGDFIRIGKMSFTHDVGRCGINTARQSLQDFGDNICVGHSHRASIVYSGTVEGSTHVGMNVGWLGDYNAIDYRNRHTAKREWQHSFGFIYQDSEGVSYCNLVPIIDGCCVVDGKFVCV